MSYNKIGGEKFPEAGSMHVWRWASRRCKGGWGMPRSRPRGWMISGRAGLRPG